MNRLKSEEESNIHKVWILLEGFLSARSRNTAKTYKGIFKEWIQFLGAEWGTDQGAEKLLSASTVHGAQFRTALSEKPGEKPRKLSTQAYQAGLTSKGKKRQKADGMQSTLGNATIAKKLTALRRLYRTLIASQCDITHNPFESDLIPSPPARSGRKRPTEMVPFAQVQDLLNCPDTSTSKGLRDYTMLALLFGAGLRRSELCGLRMRDINRTAKGTMYIVLRGTKGKQDAALPLAPWCAERVQKLYDARKEEGAEEGDFLFISYTGQGGKAPTSYPLSESGVYKLFRQYAKRVGITEWVTPHSARATAITRLLTQGSSHREVQEFSRHASIQMVEVYDKRRLSLEDNPALGLHFEEKKQIPE